MNEFNTTLRDRRAVRPDMAVDAGLRAFMLGVYNKMGFGLLVSPGRPPRSRRCATPCSLSPTVA